MEAGLEAVDYYDPPNLTFPFGSYICVVDIDKGTGEVNVRRFVAIDDCGNIINPMIVDGQIHGGLTMGLAPALYEEITYDELGNNMAGTFMDYLLPTAVETPAWETAKTDHPVAASPDRRQGGGGVGDGRRPAAIANAVVDALWHLGVRNIDIPITPPEGLGASSTRRAWRSSAHARAGTSPVPRRRSLRRPGRRARGGRAGRSRSPRWWRPAADLGAAGGVAGSSIPTARSRAGSAAAALSRSSSARRCGRSRTPSRDCSGCRRTVRARAAGPTASSSSS